MISIPSGAKLVGPVPGQPYSRYTTNDSLGREITFYVSEESKGRNLPIVLFVQGSGIESQFVLRNGRAIPRYGHSAVEKAFRSRARVLLVEKPGVQYLDPGGQDSETDARPEFHREHTLERWSTALLAALNAARSLPGVAKAPCLVMGHSEGGLVACSVTRQDKLVTHVASLAGGGASSLYDFVTLAGRGTLYNNRSGPEAEQFVWNKWKAIQKEPDRIDRFFLGYTYRKWFSFFRTSPLKELTDYRGRIFIGQGVDDTAMTVESADVLNATLLSQGHDVAYERWAHANHSFRLSDQPTVDGWLKMMEKIRDWVGLAR